MVELFSNVSEDVKKATRFWVDTALLTKNPKRAAESIYEFQKSLKDEEEKAFVDFYFTMKVLQEGEENESNSD